MDGSFLLILLGIGALLAFGDFFSSSGDDDNGNEFPRPGEEEEPEPERNGTPGNDLIFGTGGQVINALGGDDRVITAGDDTVFGGEGDDTLTSIGGGATLFGGPGEDQFIIEITGTDEDGGLLNLSGAPVAPTIIGDFNPGEDRLVLDLRQSGLVLEEGEPVVLTGIEAPDGEGLMVQVNGVNVVQLSSYGGDDMQAALEALATDFDAIRVIGAEFEFPETEEERIARTGIGNRGDNLIIAQGGLDEYRGLQGDDTLVGFTGPGVSLFGNSGDDLIVAFGNDSAFGGSGDDTLIGDFLIASEGPQVLDGGYGHDLLISHGGSVMTGGPGEDTFVISPAGIDDDGNFMAADGTPLPVSVITDFNTERDTLVLDLQRSSQDDVVRWALEATGEYDSSRPVPVFGDEIEITVVATEDGSMVLVDGIEFVELQGLTPEQVAADVTIQVQGAEYALALPEDDTLPEDVELPGTLIEPGLSQQLDEFGAPTYYLNEDYVGDGLIGERAVIDLTLYQGDLSVTVDETGTVLIEDANDDRFSLTLDSVTRIFIGEGQNTVDASASNADAIIISSGPDNTIIAGSGSIVVESYAGGADIQLGAGEATVFALSGNDTITGGSGRLNISAAALGDSSIVFNPFGEETDLFQPGPTVIEGGDGRLEVTIGTGDTLALGAGPNFVSVFGTSSTDLGPAIITGFNPDPSGVDTFAFVTVAEFEAGESPPVPSAVLEQRGDDLFVVENGLDMVRFVNLSLADVQDLSADRFDLSQTFVF